MSKSSGKQSGIIIALVVLVVVLVIALTYLGVFGSTEKQYQWYTTFKATSDQPYGTKFMSELLKTYRPGGKFTYNDKKPLHELLDSVRTDKPTDYIFIGQSLYLSEKDDDALRSFVSAGNNAFISSTSAPDEFIAWIYDTDECSAELDYKEPYADFVELNFFHDTLRRDRGYIYRFRMGNKDMTYNWSWLNADVFCDSTRSIVPLGYIAPDHVNFLKIPYGEGNVFIHTNPLVFTNYFLTKKDKMAYVSGVFSHLDGTDVIWDEYSKVPIRRDVNDYDSPLYYILKQPSLKYAWWMMIGFVILYVVFAARRTQRVIPIVEPKANTSLEFVKLISSLHFQNGNHLDIARKKMKYFQYFIRAKYGIQTQHSREEQIKRLAEKSKVNEQQVRSIFEQYDVIEKHAHYNTAQDRLVDFYYSIEYFYKHCK
jgi:hypothetical protein